MSIYSHQFGSLDHVSTLRHDRIKDAAKVEQAVKEALSYYDVDLIIRRALREPYPAEAARGFLNYAVRMVTEARVYVMDETKFIYEYAIIELLSRFDDVLKEVQACLRQQ